MAQTVLIVGPSGSGKTSSIRSLNPEETFIINNDRKGGILPWKGSREQYKELQNYFVPSESNGMEETMLMLSLIDGKPARVNRQAFLNKFNCKPTELEEKIKSACQVYSKYKTVIVDSLNGLGNDTEMIKFRKARQANGDMRSQWRDWSEDAYSLVSYCSDMRKDLTVFITTHVGEQKKVGSAGEETISCVLINGRKMERIVLESKFSIVLFSVIEYGEDGKNKYFFETQSNYSTGKSPLGMFEDFRIPNDLQFVLDKINAY